MKINTLTLYLWALIYTCTYYFLISENALLEDPTSYYEQYQIANISWSDFIDAISQLFNSGMDSSTQISFSKINIIAHVYFGSLAYFPFQIFLFLNMFFLSCIAFLVFRKIIDLSPITIFLMLFSLPMAVNMFFTWRQGLAQFLIGYVILRAKNYKKTAILIMSTLIHPIGLAMINERQLKNFFPTTLTKIIIIIFFISAGVFIGNFTTIRMSDNTLDPLSFKLLLWILIYILYSAPLIIYRKKIDLSNSNFIIFLSLLFGYIIFSTEIVGVSRLVSFGSISAMFYSIYLLPNTFQYYRILSPTIFCFYLLFFRSSI